ncbi:MAG: stalk domain-containing protein [Bacillota bacterium]|nr:stalk domain-containing protein [Bacillota bacterium]
MKRIITFLLAAVLTVPLLMQSAWAQVAQKQVSVFIDNLPISFTTPPELKNNSTLVPFRAIGEAIGVSLDWNGNTRTITANDGENTVVLQIGNKIATINGTKITLSAAPYISHNSTLVPLRFFSEAFNCKVDWDSVTYTAYISSTAKAMTVIGYYALGDSWQDLFGKSYPDTDMGNTKLISDLAFGWYSLDKDYNLITNSSTGWKKPDGWEKALEAAKTYNMKTEMAINLTDTNSAIYNLISNPDTSEKVAESIAKEAVAYNGVNLDFEGLGWNDSGDRLTQVRNYFTSFIQNLSAKLKAENVELTLSLLAPNSSYPGYDYAALGKLADRIVIMAYDYNAQPSPEPVNKVIQAVEMAKQAVPAEKLILGISAYNEDELSISTKVAIAKQYGLKGIALWRLGLVSDEMWAKLAEIVRAAK